jgi:hypothetical protein
MKLAPLLLISLLASCGRGSDVPTAEENRQLDEAEQMLNEAPANLEAVDDYGLGSSNEGRAE